MIRDIQLFPSFAIVIQPLDPLQLTGQYLLAKWCYVVDFALILFSYEANYTALLHLGERAIHCARANLHLAVCHMFDTLTNRIAMHLRLQTE
jgi:hypothetical protein